MQYTVYVYRSKIVEEVDTVVVQAADEAAAKTRALEMAPDCDGWEESDPSNHGGKEYRYEASIDKTRSAESEPLRPLRWSFDNEVIYDGWTDDTYWNGFINVCVTPETRDRIAACALEAGYADAATDAGDFLALPVIDGKVWLSGGYCTSEVRSSEIDG
jgi:hypothetical protein